MADDLRRVIGKAIRYAALLAVPATLVVVGVEMVVGPVDIPPYVLAFMAGVLASGNPHSPDLFVVYAVIVFENFALLFSAILLFLLAARRGQLGGQTKRE